MREESKDIVWNKVITFGSFVVQFPFLIKNYNERPHEPHRSPEKPVQINKDICSKL